MKNKELEDIEIDLFLEAVLKRYGYDFKNYSRGSLIRRIEHRMALAQIKHVSEMIPRVLFDEDFFESFLKDLSITVTEFFRDPNFFKEIRENVIPNLKTYPFIKIWHAGCATGEEVYSMAIMLKEEGFLEKTQIYATDYNNQSLKIAEKGVYPLEKIKKHTENYNKSGGRKSFSDYYHSKYNHVQFDRKLNDNITFSNHNLVTDGSFGEMHLIICRNVLIYFDQTLQSKVLFLFKNSLVRQGFLCLGPKEVLKFSTVEEDFVTIHEKMKIYKKHERLSK